jgi:hypothetical protein
MINEQKIKAIIEKHKPHLFDVIDHFIGSPNLIYSDRLWVHSVVIRYTF